MTTQAITNFMPSTAETSKTKMQDTAASDTPFNKILNREMADRQNSDAAENTTTNTPAAASKQETSMAEAPSKAVVEKIKQEKEEPLDAPTAEEILAMATQFAQQGETSPKTAAPTDLEKAAKASTVSSVQVLPSDVTNTAADAALRPGQQLPDTEITDATANKETDGDAVLKNGKNQKNFNDALNKAGAQKQTQVSTANDRSAQTTETVLTETVQNFEEILANQSAQSAKNTSSDTPDIATVITPMQQAASAITDKVMNASSNNITQEIGSAGWNQAIGQKIVWMVGKGEQSASLTLNPPRSGSNACRLECLEYPCQCQLLFPACRSARCTGSSVAETSRNVR